MRRILCAVFRQDLRLIWRDGQGGRVLTFMFIAATLLPFGIGPDLAYLQMLASGLLWVILLLALLLSFDGLFQADFEDGSLDQLFLLLAPLELIILAKIAAHWLGLVLPLLFAVPIVGLLLNIDALRLPGLVFIMILGSPALVLLGALGASLVVSLRRASLLAAIIIMPLYVPIIIFGAGGTQKILAHKLSGNFSDIWPVIGDEISILLLMDCAALLLVPLAIAAVLRTTVR